MLYVHTRLRVFFFVLKVFFKKIIFLILNYFFIFLDRFDMSMSKIKFKNNNILMHLQSKILWKVTTIIIPNRLWKKNLK
jgi:hypothetical protein